MNKLINRLIKNCSSLVESKVKFLFFICILLSILIQSYLLSTNIGDIDETKYALLSNLLNIFISIGFFGGMLYLGLFIHCKDRISGNEHKEESQAKYILIIFSSATILISIISLVISFFTWSFQIWTS